MPIPRRLSTVLLLSIVCFTAPAWADFQAGLDAYNRKDYATALREWKPLAEQGHALAQYHLGILYDQGYGVPQDYGQAWRWFGKAAIQNHSDAQYNFGVMYAQGHGVPQDYGHARQWYEKAAAQGMPEAQLNLGLLYGEGMGVPQNYRKARYWWEKLRPRETQRPSSILGCCITMAMA